MACIVERLAETVQPCPVDIFRLLFGILAFLIVFCALEIVGSNVVWVRPIIDKLVVVDHVVLVHIHHTHVLVNYISALI